MSIGYEVYGTRSDSRKRKKLAKEAMLKLAELGTEIPGELYDIIEEESIDISKAVTEEFENGESKFVVDINKLPEGVDKIVFKIS